MLNLLDKKRVENIGRNREIVKCIAEAILFCAKQCIALRGDIETTSTCTNPGNFLSILKLMSKHNDVLKIISNMHSSHILVWGLKATCYFSSVANERGTLESTEPNFAPPQYKTWLRA